MTTPGVTHSLSLSLTHTHTHTHRDTSKAARWPSHLVAFSEGSPQSWSCPIPNPAAPVRMKSAEFPSTALSPSAFVPRPLWRMPAQRWTARSVFQESSKWPGLGQRLATTPLFCGLLFLISLYIISQGKGMTKPFLLQSGFICQFSV